MRVLLLVDYSNLMYRAYYACSQQIITRPWLPIVRYFDMMRTCIKRIKERYGKDVYLEVIFAGESRKTLRRTEIDPTYKSHRKPNKDETFRNFRQILSIIVEDCGWKIISCDGAEADDVIATITTQTSYRGECDCEVPCKVCKCGSKFIKVPVVIFSNDRDLRQLIQFDQVSIFQAPNIFYTYDDFIKEYGISPEHFSAYKSLVGDKSDNIQGVDGWGPVKAQKEINAGTWIETLETEGIVAEYSYVKSLELVQLDYHLKGLPLHGTQMELDGMLRYPELLMKMYNNSKICLTEIELALFKCEEVFYDTNT